MSVRWVSCVLMSVFVGCGTEPAGVVEIEPASTSDAALRSGTFDYRIAKTVQLPNLFGFPEYENLDVPVYESLGRRGPGILLVHGNSASSRSFVRQVFGSLGLTQKLYLLDLPGFGRAGQVDPSRDFPIDELGVPQGFPEYQLGLIEAIGVVAQDPDLAPSVFVGWSLGGDLLILAQGLGLIPDPAGFLIFGSAPAGAAPPTTEFPFSEPNVPGLPLSVLTSFGFAFQVDGTSPLGFNLNGQFTDPVPSFADPVAQMAPTVGDAYLRAFFDERQRERGRVPRFFLEDGFDRSDARARGSVGAVGLGLLPPGGLPDPLEVLVALAGDPTDPGDDIPIAVVLGDEDPFINPDYLEDLRTNGGLPTLWRDKIISIRGAGHATHYEAPGRFNSIVQSFARSVTDKTP
ncbi:MAG: alpha/beta hydrolase [Myxococcota bacterium]